MIFDFRKHSFVPGRHYTTQELTRIADDAPTPLTDGGLAVTHRGENAQYIFRPVFTPTLRDMQPFLKRADAVFYCDGKQIAEWDGPLPQNGDLYLKLEGEPYYYQVIGRSLVQIEEDGPAQWMIQLQPFSQAVPVVEKSYLCGWIDGRCSRSLLVPAQHEVEARQRFVDYFYMKEELVISAGAVTTQEIETWHEPGNVQ